MLKRKKDKDDDVEDIGKSTTYSNIIGTQTLKISVLLFLLFILLSSDVFIDRVLSSVSTYVEGRHCTTKGMIAQGVLLSIGYIIIHTLVSYDYI